MERLLRCIERSIAVVKRFLLVSLVSNSALFAANDTSIARILANKAQASRDAGEIVRPFLLFSEAVKRDPDNQAYRQNRDSLAATAGLLLKTQLESADVSSDLVEAERETAENSLADAKVSSAPEPVAEPAPSEPTAAAQPSAETAAPSVGEEAVAMDSASTSQKPESVLPSNLSISARFRQNAALSMRGPIRLAENRTYSYLDLAYDLWTSPNSKYQVRFSASARGYFDSVFDLTRRYSGSVRENQEYQAELRRAVISFTAPGWTIHAGRQQVVWGEAIGMFIADVVNPKDYRQFLVPEVDDIRIPLAALDVQKSLGNASKFELFWSPDVRTSQLPVAGSEFTFFSPSSALPTRTISLKPARRLGNSTVGMRYSWLTHGWDSSVFYLRSLQDLPATSSSLQSGANPFVNLIQGFPQVDHYAVTTSKPLGDFVFKAEAIYARGQRFATRELGPALARDTVSGMIGFSYPLKYQYLLDVQYFQNSLFSGAGALYQPALRSGFSVRVADVASLRRFKPSIQSVASINQHDYWISPKLTVRIVDSLFTTIGYDWFAGTPETLFGQFRDASRLGLSLFWKAK
jgi:hypothetical protein